MSEVKRREEKPSSSSPCCASAALACPSFCPRGKSGGVEKTFFFAAFLWGNRRWLSCPLERKNPPPPWERRKILAILGCRSP